MGAFIVKIFAFLMALLVPSMTGYVSKSKQSSVQSDAKCIFNSAATALVELDSNGENISQYNGEWDESNIPEALYSLMNDYYSSEGMDFTLIIENGMVESVTVEDGDYTGTYPFS